MNPKIICFGEILWDMLPSGHLPGGAPMNVAIHLKYHGFDPVLISRVGSDDLGQALLDFLQANGLATAHIQLGKTHLTGVVKVNLDDKNEVTYKIVEPVAWDYIQYQERVAQLVAESDVFIYGSLACRCLGSRVTLLQYLPWARHKVFDVNLRPPHYQPENVLRLLQFANLVKMNQQELDIISGWLGLEGGERQKMAAIRQRYNLQLLLVTRGENGACALSGQHYAEHPGFRVRVEDTIGSGDAFLATFLSAYLQQQPVAACLASACQAGAFVASRKGATPAYDPLLLAQSLSPVLLEA